MPRIVYTADLHGDLEHYQALLRLGVETGAAAVVVAGDLLPHAITGAAALQTQRAFVEQALLPLLRAVRAAQPDLAVLLIPGNDDWAAAVAGLSAAPEVTWIHGARAYVGDVAVVGYGCVPVTPFSIKDFERRDLATDRANPAWFGRAFRSAGDELAPVDAAALDDLPSMAEELAALPAAEVYVTHAPPFGSDLDLATGRRQLGSHAVRALIEQRQPALTLHGHIHEAPALSGRWAARIGRSWCVNVGRDGHGPRAVVIDLVDGQVVGLEHTVYGRIAL